MKLRNLALTAGLLVSSTAFSLGLGEYKLNSSLNEPLDMEVELLNIGDMGELEMLVGLGSREDFEQAGVERLFLLTDLRFKVDLSTPSKPMVRITSKKPIREPYLDFLVEVQWPSGRLLREYTLLLDLPLYATESPSAKKIEAASQGSQQTPKPAPRQTVNTGSSPAPSSAPALTVGDGEYRVGSGDTVWGIARKIKPADASLSQTMDAIKQYNEHAFIDNNINLLKKGAIIRLPEGSEIDRLSDEQPVSNLALDTTSTLDEQAAEAPFLDGDVASGEETVTESPELGGGRLKLATVDQNDALSVSGTGGDSLESGTAVGGSDAVSLDITVVQEELDKTQRENIELKAKLANLEEQVATMNRLVEINDDSLRAAQVASQQEPVGEENAESPTADTAVDAVSTTETTETPAVAAPASEEKKEKTGLAAWMDMLLYPLIALLAFLLAVVLFFKNRKQDEEVDELSLQSLVDNSEPEPEDKPEEPVEQLTEKEKEVIAEEVPEFDIKEINDYQGLELKEDEDIDPAGEADIYLSLGNYNQAESVLLKAIGEDNANTALRLKLLEVYVNANELEKFDTQRLELKALDDTAAYDRALVLRGELTPDLLPEQQEQQEMEVEEAAQEESLQQDAEQQDLQQLDPQEESPEEESPRVEDSALEDVVETNPEQESAELVTESASAPNEDFDLDLDLDNVDIDSLVSEIDVDMDDITQSQEDAEKSLEELDLGVEGELGDEMNVLEGADEIGTKLELAEAYLSMGDSEGARSILDEVIAEGDDAQKEKAQSLLESVT